MMKNEDFHRFAEKFIDDAHNLLNELEGKLLELEQDISNQEHIEAVFRAMHTLKGLGGMFGFNTISEYTHHLETIYDKIREGLMAIDSSIFELTFESVDHLRNLLSDQELKNPKIAARNTELTLQLKNISEVKQQFASDLIQPLKKDNTNENSQEFTWHIQFLCTEELIKRAVNILYIFQDLAKLGSFTIFKQPAEILIDLHPKAEIWGILLTSHANLAQIEEVFMFVPDAVTIVKFANPLPPDNTGDITKYANSPLSILELAKKLGNKSNRDNMPAEIDKTETNDRESFKALNKIPRISVGTDKLDKLMYLVSELFTTRSELVIATNNTDMTRIKIAVEKIDKLSSQFRNNALSIRLVPLRELTLKFKRLIRDLSNQLDKNIDFEIKGDETELDKNLVDNLVDPFMHLIRNCIDHGIENSEIRKANNKPGIGVISFEAYQAGNNVHIKISDDGKGIDTDYIRNKAIEKGFIQPNAQLIERELLELIFLPGFSTAESLTQVSGRGVGMDVVKRAITNLRGSVEIESQKGKGTSFIIKLQQTIAIMDTLLIRAGTSYFTISLEEIEVCELINHHNLYERQNNHLQLAGDLIPFISLRQTFFINGNSPETERIIVIKRSNIRFAIIADSIIGQYQAVIKPLDSALKHKEYLSGASIMGDGNIAFMLDTYQLGCEQKLGY